MCDCYAKYRVITLLKGHGPSFVTRIRTVTDGTVDGPFSKYPDIITIPDDIFQSVGGGNGIFGSICEYDYDGYFNRFDCTIQTMRKKSDADLHERILN